jgi:multimeric flavodoxin WrbA
MRITVFNGSPKGKKGNTNFIVEEFLRGAIIEGAETENIFLARKKIRHCVGCFDCWTKTPGKCIIKDDMNELIEKFINSDIVVFATPLYVDNVSGIMKNFMDRMIPIVEPYFNKDENGECRHKKRYEKYPKIVVISNCGFPEQSHFQVLKLLFRRIARNIHSEVIAEIYRGEGEILQIDLLMMKPFISKYKKVLRVAGQELVKNGKFSEQTKEKLEKPIIPYRFYISGANKSWDKEEKN